MLDKFSERCYTIYSEKRRGFIMYILLFIFAYIIILLVISSMRSDTTLRRIILKIGVIETTFKYKGKDVSIRITETKETPKTAFSSYYDIYQYTLYINESPIIIIWEINRISKRYEIIKNDAVFKMDGLIKLLKSYYKGWEKRNNYTGYTDNRKNII